MKVVIRGLRRHLHCAVIGKAEAALLRATHGIDDYDAIGSSCAVDRCGGRILKHRHPLDHGGINAREISLKRHPVHHDQWHGGALERGDTADLEFTPPARLQSGDASLQPLKQ